MSSSVPKQYHDLNEDSKEEQLRHAEVLRKFEAQKRARAISVPTAIDEIKQRLRELGQPVTLFAEGHADRRERLREAIAHLELGQEELQKLQTYMNQGGAAPPAPTTATGASQEQLVKQKEVFYSAAVEGLVQARKELCAWTFERAHERLQRTKRVREEEELQRAEDRQAQALYAHSCDLDLNASQFGDERPLSTVRYCSSGATVASSALSGTVKLWDSSSLTNLGVLRNHSDRVTAVAWHPDSGAVDGPSLLASSSADGSCNVYDARRVASPDAMQTTEEAAQPLLHKLKGHHGVVSSCEFHAGGRLLGTAGHDYSWRLWDVETGSELLLQDGHVKECSALGFHPDGSLAMTGDAGGVALLWDLRSGQCVAPFQGHIKKISGVSFARNGYQVATCSLDNTVKIWDLRKKKCGYTLPAHSNVLSDVKFSACGELLLTASFDGTMKIWGARDFHILRTLSGHSGKVMSCDFAPDERHVVSAGFDRTIKLWAHKDEF